MAETAEEIISIISETDSAIRKQLRQELYLDYIVIAAYWLLFMALSALLAQQIPGWGIGLATIAAISITAAAQLDFLENLRLFSLLDTPAEAPDLQKRVMNVRAASRPKWGAIFVSIGVLALIFFSSSDWRLWTIGGLYLLTAIVGLFGLWRYRPAVEWAYFLMSLAILFTGVVFLFLPEIILVNR